MIPLGEFNRETKSEEVKAEMFKDSSWRKGLPDWDLAGHTGVWKDRGLHGYPQGPRKGTVPQRNWQ